MSAPSAAGAPDALARATQVTLMCEKLSTIIAPLLPSASSGANPASSLTAALQIAQQATPTSAFDPKVPPPPPSPFTAFSQLVKLLQDYVSLHQSQRKVTHPVESERGASTPQEQAARSVALNKVSILLYVIVASTNISIGPSCSESLLAFGKFLMDILKYSISRVLIRMND